MNVVIAGANTETLAEAFADHDADVSTVDVANRPALEDAGIHDADVYVLTEADQATSIVVARDLEPDLRVVAYTGDSLPEFVSGQQVLAMDPELLDPDAFVETLLE